MSETRRVWIYADPASGVELHDAPGIGTEIEAPIELVEAFEEAQAQLRSLGDQLLQLVPAPSWE